MTEPFTTSVQEMDRAYLEPAFEPALGARLCRLFSTGTQC